LGLVTQVLRAGVEGIFNQRNKMNEEHTPVAEHAMNSKGNWTPGPWELGPAIDSRKVFSGDSVIAEAWPTTINMDEAQANARLIAAAPDLLHNLEVVTERLTAWMTISDPDDVTDDDRQALVDSRNAIAQATGEKA
jgi:hypothetical protein